MSAFARPCPHQAHRAWWHKAVRPCTIPEFSSHAHQRGVAVRPRVRSFASPAMRRRSASRPCPAPQMNDFNSCPQTAKMISAWRSRCFRMACAQAEALFPSASRAPPPPFDHAQDFSLRCRAETHPSPRKFACGWIVLPPKRVDLCEQVIRVSKKLARPSRSGNVASPPDSTMRPFSPAARLASGCNSRRGDGAGYPRPKSARVRHVAATGGTLPGQGIACTAPAPSSDRRAQRQALVLLNISMK